MPSYTRTPVQNNSDLNRLAGNASTVAALLSAIAIVPMADAHRDLGTCSSMALELAQDLFALQGSPVRNARPVINTERSGEGALGTAALSHTEMRLLAAFRKVKDRQQQEMLMLAELQAKDFSIRTRPVFQLIAGGAA